LQLKYDLGTFTTERERKRNRERKKEREKERERKLEKRIINKNLSFLFFILYIFPLLYLPPKKIVTSSSVAM